MDKLCEVLIDMEFMYKIAEMQYISPHALLLGLWVNELRSVQN